jgi:hypothetical protein
MLTEMKIQVLKGQSEMMSLVLVKMVNGKVVGSASCETTRQVRFGVTLASGIVELEQI